MLKISIHQPTGLKYAHISGYSYGALLLPHEHSDYKTLNNNLLLLRGQGWCI